MALRGTHGVKYIDVVVADDVAEILCACVGTCVMARVPGIPIPRPPSLLPSSDSLRGRTRAIDRSAVWHFFLLRGYTPPPSTTEDVTLIYLDCNAATSRTAAILDGRPFWKTNKARAIIVKTPHLNGNIFESIYTHKIHVIINLIFLGVCKGL